MNVLLNTGNVFAFEVQLKQLFNGLFTMQQENTEYRRVLYLQYETIFVITNNLGNGKENSFLLEHRSRINRPPKTMLWFDSSIGKSATPELQRSRYKIKLLHTKEMPVYKG